MKDTKKAITTLGTSCSLEEWNVKTNLPKNRRASIICQKKLLEMEGLLFDGIDNGWTAKKIVSVFSGKDSAVLMFFVLLDEFFADKTVGSSTKRGYETKKNKFYKFLGNKDIRFKDIDYDLLKRYRRNLDDQGVKSANRYMKFI